jgi:hypothetical protein
MSLSFSGQHSSGIPMPLHLARDLSAIGKSHSETLAGYVARVRDLAFKDFGFHRILWPTSIICAGQAEP